MTRAEVTRAWGEDAQPDAVGGADPAQCDEFRPKDAPAGTLVMVENGRLTRISLIRDSKVSTDRDLKLGATEAQVRAAYGGRLIVEPHKYVDAPARYLLAWTTPDERGVLYETDGEGVVRAIRAGGPSIRYVEGCA